MKKHRWLAVISAMVMALAFSGCQINSDNHEHSFSKDWTSDATDHWHAATCEHTKEVSDKAAHTFGDYVSNNDATTESDGTKTRKCSVCGYEDTVTDEGSKIEIVATPTFSIESGAINSGTEVTITCSTEGAKIYYTTDGSEPTASGTAYTAAISVIPPLTLKAIAVKSGMNDSAVASVSYTIKETVATPTFSVESGAVNSGTSVTITCSTEGAKIYYTTDGSDPTAASTEYTAAISITEAVTVKAIAVKSGMNDSVVASVSYTIKETVATPTFSVESGAVNSGIEVTITCATEGAKIYYTTDGTEPTASGTEYTAAISVTAAVTVKAIAVKSGMNDSAVASASYTIYTPKYSVGDFVLKNGTVLSKDETPESGTVAAVIVRADTLTKPALGVGIVHNEMAWCTSSATGYDQNIKALQGDKTSGYMDGSDGWEKLKAACSDAASNPGNYPAWNYSLTYAKTNNLTGDLATGWYLPTVAELYTIYQNKTAVNESLSKAGGSTFGTWWYRSCCQYPYIDNKAPGLGFGDGKVYYYYKDNGGGYVCSVRAFN